MTNVKVGDVVVTDIARIVYASVREARRALEATRAGNALSDGINVIMSGTLLLVLAIEEHDMVHVCTDKFVGIIYAYALRPVAPHHKE